MVEFSLAPGRLAPGKRVYAVGDVHGCADRLATLHAAITADLAARPIRHSTLVHLGDYVDRGPDSAGVVARIAAGPAITATVNLLGNHERMMLDALAADDPRAIAHWLMNGAAPSLASWGVPRGAAPRDWAARIPADHLARLRGLALTHRSDDYLFVHAGIRPGRPLRRQLEEDLIWIREPFLSYAGDLGAVIVHGHTPVPAPVVRPNRIGIDTGAVLGGPLTCAVLEADQVGFISA